MLEKYDLIGSVEGTATLQLYSGSLMSVNGPKGPSSMGSLSDRGLGFGASGYTGDAPGIGTFSNFKPATNLNLGPGIAQKTDFNLIERYRPPDPTPTIHINNELILSNVKKNNKINPLLSNMHINLD